MKNIKQKLALGVFFVGLGVLAYEPAMNFYIEHSMEETLEQEVVPINEIIAKEPERNAKSNIEEQPEKKVVEEEAVDPHLPQDTYYDMDSRQLVVGKLSIPSVDLNLAIIKGVGQENGDPMEKGAATNKEGQEMGLRNYVLASHAMKNPTLLFSPLFGVDFGDKVYITDEDKVYVYEVSGVETVEPERVDILNDVEGRKMITLYTCTQAGSKRLVVTGDLVETLDYNEETSVNFD